MKNSQNKTRATFSDNLKNLRKLLPNLVSILEDGKQDNWYASAWLESNRWMMYTAAILENSQESTDRGVVLRVFVDGVCYERASNKLDPESLTTLAKDFRGDLDKKHPPSYNYTKKAYRPLTWQEEIKRGLSAEISTQIPSNVNASSEVHFGVLCGEDPHKTKMDTLKERASFARKNLFDRANNFIVEENKTRSSDNQYENLSDIRTIMRQILEISVFVDREKNISQILPSSSIVAVGISKCGKTSLGVCGGLGGLEIATLDEESSDVATINCLRLTKADRLIPGRYQVITGPDVTGVIAHEAFGHTQEGDTWMKGRSIAENLHNNKTKVGNDQATIVNHPDMFSKDEHHYGSNGSHFFDHEGELGRKQQILDKGMLSTPMTDFISAYTLNVSRTSNGKRESWRRPLMARQTNTYFTPGDKTLSELISMVKHGHLARWGNGGMEDPKGGSLTAGAAYFEEIIDGKLTGKVLLGPSGGHIELSDPVFSLLDKIVAKSKTVNADNIPDVKLGGCGKYHKEGVNAGCGGPYILWQDINCG